MTTILLRLGDLSSLERCRYILLCSELSSTSPRYLRLLPFPHLHNGRKRRNLMIRDAVGSHAHRNFPTCTKKVFKNSLKNFPLSLCLSPFASFSLSPPLSLSLPLSLSFPLSPPPLSLSLSLSPLSLSLSLPLPPLSLYLSLSAYLLFCCFILACCLTS